MSQLAHEVVEVKPHVFPAMSPSRSLKTCGGRNTVFNSEAQSAAGLVPRLLQRGVRRFRIEFVRESREEAVAVLSVCADLLAGRIRLEALLRSLHVTARQGMGAMQLLGVRGVQYEA